MSVSKDKTVALLAAIVVALEVTLDGNIVALAVLLILHLAVFALKLALTFAALLVEDEVYVLSLAGLLSVLAREVAHVERVDLINGCASAVLTWVESLSVLAAQLTLGALVLHEALARVLVEVVAMGALELLSAGLVATVVAGEVGGLGDLRGLRLGSGRHVAAWVVVLPSSCGSGKSCQSFKHFS